jgi:predicted phage terminase large subunit-like protein
VDLDLLDSLLDDEPADDPFGSPSLGAIDDVLRRIEREKCKRSFAYFFKAGWHVINRKVRLVWNWHIGVICDHVEAVFRELLKARDDEDYIMKVQNLVVNVPPRSAKSLIVSVFAPAWAWLHDPTLKIAARSATGEVVNRDAGFFRDVVGSPWYQELFDPAWQIGGKGDSGKPLADGVKKYENTEGGFRFSAPIMSKAVGTGADISLYDDPHDPEDAESDAKRDAQVNKYKNALHNRVEDGMRCVRMLIMQRLHEGDLTGYLELQNNARLNRYLKDNPGVEEEEARQAICSAMYGGWVHVVIPQEFEPEHPCKPHLVNALGWKDPRTVKGELLFPKRFTPELVAQYKEDLQDYGYAGQHQQRPAPEDGGMFKRKHWRFYHHWDTERRPTAPVMRPTGCLTPQECKPVILPQKMEVIHVSIDAATKDKKKGSNYGILSLGYKGTDVYFLADKTGTMSFPDCIEIVKQLKDEYPFAYFLIEDKANGPAVVQTLRDEIPGLIEVNPQGDKIARARAMRAQYQANHFFLPEGESWGHPIVHEFSVFPNGTNDDRVDATSQSVIYQLIEGADVAYARALCS